MSYCLGIIPVEEEGLRYVKECSGSVTRGFLLNRGRAKKCMHMPRCHGRKKLISSGIQVVTGKLMGAGHGHRQCELDVHLLLVSGEPWEAMAYCWCSFGIAKENRPSSRSYIY